MRRVRYVIGGLDDPIEKMRAQALERKRDFKRKLDRKFLNQVNVFELMQRARESEYYPKRCPFCHSKKIREWMEWGYCKKCDVRFRQPRDRPSNFCDICGSKLERAHLIVVNLSAAGLRQNKEGKVEKGEFLSATVSIEFKFWCVDCKAVFGLLKDRDRIRLGDPSFEEIARKVGGDKWAFDLDPRPLEYWIARGELKEEGEE